MPGQAYRIYSGRTIGEGGRDVPVRFSTASAGLQRRDVSSEGMPWRSTPSCRGAPPPDRLDRETWRPREGDGPTVMDCIGCAETDWAVSTPPSGVFCLQRLPPQRRHG